MTAKQEAEDLLHKYRMLFMDEGEDYGEEILVSMLSIKCALIAVDELLRYSKAHGFIGLTEHYEQVKVEIVNDTIQYNTLWYKKLKL